MEYLYSQSGKSLTVVETPEEEDRLVELMDDEPDEGFEEDEPEDITTTVLEPGDDRAPGSSQQPFSTSAPAPQASTTQQDLPPQPSLSDPELLPAEPSTEPPTQASAEEQVSAIEEGN